MQIYLDVSVFFHKSIELFTVFRNFEELLNTSAI